MGCIDNAHAVALVATPPDGYRQVGRTNHGTLGAKMLATHRISTIWPSQPAELN